MHKAEGEEGGGKGGDPSGIGVVGEHLPRREINGGDPQESVDRRCVLKNKD
jgi:hypothetical protein